MKSLRKLVGWVSRKPARNVAWPGAPSVGAGPPARRRTAAEGADLENLVEEMLEQGRFALLLRTELIGNLSPALLDRCQAALADAMALTPEGEVVMGRTCASNEEEVAAREERELPRHAPVFVDRFYLDRYPVTNQQFYEFVAAGGYEQLSTWDAEILPGVLDFVDASGQPGPRFWRDGCYLQGTANHPVVGVNWYEACAFARWVGKRLPTDPEWEKAASWPVQLSATQRSQRRFPWGDTMDRRRCRVWGEEEGPVAVTAHAGGVSVGGVYQLVGNVWEWTCGNFGSWNLSSRDLVLPTAMKSIRGGAFDTYFDHQASCQFQSGEDPLARKHNIGFRCALGRYDVVDPAAYKAAQQQPAEPWDRDKSGAGGSDGLHLAEV